MAPDEKSVSFEGAGFFILKENIAPIGATRSVAVLAGFDGKDCNEAAAEPLKAGD